MCIKASSPLSPTYLPNHNPLTALTFDIAHSDLLMASLNELHTNKKQVNKCDIYGHLTLYIYYILRLVAGSQFPL